MRAPKLERKGHLHEILIMKEPRALADMAAKVPAPFLPDERTAERFFGFFTANVRNKHTRRAKQAGITSKSATATGITDYLKSDGSLAEARRMANHANSRTTQLYDRGDDTASLREYEKVGS